MTLYALLPPPPSFREESESWVLEEKLEAHTDWVRDVAWCPSVGLPISRIASCSQVSRIAILMFVYLLCAVC